jgi:protein translocase SecG subunit
MEILRYILLFIEVACSLFLIGLVLIQKSKSEGLGMAFGAGMGENLFGSRAGNVLTKMTVVFAVIFMANTLVLTLVYAGSQERSLMAGQASAPPAGLPQAQPGPVAPNAGVAPTLPQAPAAQPGEGIAVPPVAVDTGAESTPLTVEPIVVPEAGEPVPEPVATPE